MFDRAVEGTSLTRQAFKNLELGLHQEILELQARLRNSGHSLIVIVAGVEGAGKGEVVDRLNRWFDTRDVQTHAFWDETDEELERPRFWRFWQKLPARGSIAILFGAWYSEPVADAAFHDKDQASFDSELQHINELERTLCVDGTIIVKLWFHLPRDIQRQRLEADAQQSRFKQSAMLQDFDSKYDAFVGAAEQALTRTDSKLAPWHIISAADPNARDLLAGRAIGTGLQQGLDAAQLAAPGPALNVEGIDGSLATPAASATDSAVPPSLEAVDLSLALDEETYLERLAGAQRQLYELAWHLHNSRRNAIIVLEGWDAAGKGSAIRRLTAAMDARLYRVIPVAAPSDEEKDHHYLWRFWRHVPRSGYLTIYDRSWYGRVLVERVEGIAQPHEWQRAYAEINQFEEHLVQHGVSLFKFFLHISKQEQLQRFREREQNPRKHHKITEEDWRNRDKWNSYRDAVNDMVSLTSRGMAPWTLVSANDKKVARIQVLEAVCSGIEASLGS